MSVGMSSGTGWPVSAQNARTRAGMSPGRRNRSSSGSMKAVNAGAVSAMRGELLVGGAVAGRPQGSPALLDQPQADDVADQPDRAGHAALVREVGGEAHVGDDGCGHLDTDRATTCRCSGRPSIDEASGAPTTADAVSCEPGSDHPRAREAGRTGDLGPQGPRTVPGSTTSGSIAVGMPRRSSIGRAQSRARASRHWLVLAFVYSATDAPDRKWANRSPISSRRSAWPSSGSLAADHRQQLVQRVDRHELDAGGRVDLLARHRRAHAGLHHPHGPCVPVVDRVRQQPAARVEEPEVDAPRVDTDRGDGTIGAGTTQARGDLAEQVQEVPVQRAGQRHRDVGEPVDVRDREAVAVERADEDPAALRAEVDRGQAERGVSQGGRPRRAAGGTPSPGPCRDR